MAQDFSPTEIFKRATAATLRAIAERDDVTVGFGPEPAGLERRAGAPAEPAARPPGRGGGAIARRRRQRGAAAALSRRRGAQQARAERAAGAGGVRRRRAGAGRGAGLAAHGRGRRQSRSDARRAVSPARLRADHRAHRKHDGRGGAPVDPRGADQRAAAARGAARRRSVAPLARMAASARISPSSTARSSIRTPMRGPPAGCSRISTSISARPTSRRRTAEEQQGGEEAEGENQSEGEGATAGAQASDGGLARRRSGRGRAGRRRGR